ncbi:MAG: SHOCT domain-containing protein [Nitrospiraceae bacterium]|nr:SHOCT domain-containing protein [Nitrospiraceae bacterium]
MRTSLKPSKTLSAGSIAGLIFLLFFGIGFLILISSVLSQNDAPAIMRVVFYVFMCGWIGIVIFMLVYHALNLKRKKGLSLIDIETESCPHEDIPENNPMQKLRSLENLKKDGLISEEEFKTKRAEIMQQKW